MKVLLVLIIVGAVAVAATVDWRFWDRYVRFTLTPLNERGPDMYQPRFVLGGVPRPLEVAPEDSRTISPDALDAAAAYAESMNSNGLIVWRDGAIQFERYWNGNDAESMATTYSMHKTIVALMIGIAVDDGKIADIDQPAATYITEWQNDARRDITIRNLLQMAGGLENFALSEMPWSKALHLNYDSDRVAAVMAYPAVTPPGTEFKYNGTETQALLIVLERATGKSYGAYMQEKLWGPAGNGPGFLWLDRPGGTALAHIALYGSHRDWVRFGEVFLGRGRIRDRQIVSESWIAQMTTPSPLNPKYGFQTWLGSPYVAVRTYSRESGVVTKASEPFLAPDLYFADGFGAQRLYVIPSERLLIVRSGETRMDWDDSKLPNLILRGLKDSSSGPAVEPPETE
ncbi:MAG: serine hydrolase [Rhodobacteraceae bacterium]|nr:serine hydrolase [Paracoccaceae bacterium]